MNFKIIDIVSLIIIIDCLNVVIDILREGKFINDIKSKVCIFLSIILVCIYIYNGGSNIFIVLSAIFISVCFIRQLWIEKNLETYIENHEKNKNEYEHAIKEYEHAIKEYEKSIQKLKKHEEIEKKHEEIEKKYKEIGKKYEEYIKNVKKAIKIRAESIDNYEKLIIKYEEFINKYDKNVEKRQIENRTKTIKKYRKNVNLDRQITIIISKLNLIVCVIVLTYKTIALISNKTNLSADLVTLITVIVALLTAVYTTISSNKSNLSAESLWRKELMNVSSKNEICIDDLLRLRASQNYKYANKHNRDDELEKNYINAGYEVRDKIGKMTNDLYNRYIFTKSETVEISFEDQNTIRDLSIALLKYDYIKRGDNVKLTHYIIRELEEDKEYQNLLNWINKEIEVDKHKNKYVL